MGINVGGGVGVDRKRSAVRPDMNVTPLVDVVLVLLIIFMVLAPVMSESFDVRLPPKDDKDEELQQANDPSKPLVLTVAEDGSIEVNSVQLEHNELSDRLHRMFNARPDNVLYLDAHDMAAYGGVLTAIDQARLGGASPVVMITKKLE